MTNETTVFKGKMLRRAVVAALALLVVTPAPAIASEKQQAVEDWMHGMIQHAIMGRDFAWLETTSQKYRSEKQRMPSGRWSIEVFYERLQEHCGLDSREQVSPLMTEFYANWQAEYPKSPAPSIIMASCHYAAAMNLRGQGFADDVWADAWAPMFEKLEGAVAILEKNKALAGHDPHWHAIMARTHMHLNVPESVFSANIEEAIRVEPLYYTNYYHAFYHYLPRWGGSYAQAERWARRASARTSVAYGDAIYARLALALRRMHSDEEIMRDYRFDWARLKKGMLDLFETQQVPDLNHAMDFVEMSCALRDVEHAAKVWKVWQASIPDGPEFKAEVQCAPKKLAGGKN